MAYGYATYSVHRDTLSTLLPKFDDSLDYVGHLPIDQCLHYS